MRDHSGQTRRTSLAFWTLGRKGRGSRRKQGRDRSLGDGESDDAPATQDRSLSGKERRRRVAPEEVEVESELALQPYNGESKLLYNDARQLRAGTARSGFNVCSCACVASKLDDC